MTIKDLLESTSQCWHDVKKEPLDLPLAAHPVLLLARYKAEFKLLAGEFAGMNTVPKSYTDREGNEFIIDRPEFPDLYPRPYWRIYGLKKDQLCRYFFTGNPAAAGNEK